MQTVKITKAELLGILTKNRAEHRDIFLTGQTKYREAAIRILDEALADAKAGKKIRRSIGLVAPEDHTADYDRVIRMLELSVDDTIVLTSAEFEQYVMDRWRWASQFGATVSSYGVSNKYEVLGDEE